MTLPKQGIQIFGLTEIAIGTITLLAIVVSLVKGTSAKPPNVLTFVIISSLISVALGAGVLLKEKHSRKLLIFFAGWVILSKILIYAKIMTLCCSLETTISSNLKNLISIAYHSILILYFHHRSIKAEFER
jgi:hypothetical protein